MKGAERLKELIEGAKDAKGRRIYKRNIAAAIGITPQHLSNLLNGHNEWRLSQIEKLCEFLDVTLAQAFLKKGEDVELFVVLQTILEAGPEPRKAIAWNIHGISKQIALSGPRIKDKRSQTPRKKALA